MDGGSRSNGGELQAGGDPILWPSLKAGTFAATAGVLFGGTAGIIRTTTPVLFATASGIQCGILGASYWATRTAVLNAWDTGALTTSDRRKATAIGGGVAGGTAGLLRGPSHVIPGIIVMSGMGYLAQTVYDRLDARHTEQVKNEEENPQKPFWNRIAESKWFPLKTLSDEDYEGILQEKILKLDVEIAMIDDRIQKIQNDAATDKDDISDSKRE